MRSSSGEHWVALDQIRCLAAFLVFSWHFLHGHDGLPIAFGSAPAVFPLALADEGQTGVALFMTLSGYLFAKLLGGRELDFVAFLRNRALRLLPLALLSVTALLIGYEVTGGSAGLAHGVALLVGGLFNPFVPLDGGLWSVLVETQFYVLLPLLLAMQRRWTGALPVLVVCMIALRALLAWYGYPVAYLAYWTLLGRIDQFALGMTAFWFRDRIAGRNRLARSILVGFLLFYAALDADGGSRAGDMTASPGLWIVLPTMEGAAYAILIAWVDARGRALGGIAGRWAAKAGTWSYSIYLLHAFVVFRAPFWIERWVMPIDNFYIALFWTILCFILFLPVAWLGHTVVERPFLSLRRSYLREPAGLPVSPIEPRMAGA